ncbi:hypothetical protein [Streptomyces sp. NPDC090621]|uniref:hypothetical protein n=1 Tax=Streptomyces sp. NPDC090621 TaxID=3365966 RepID=UPI003810D966
MSAGDARPAPSRRPWGLVLSGVCGNWDTKGEWRWITRRYFQLEEEQLQAHIRTYQIVERLLAVRQRQHKARPAAEQEHLAAIEALLQRQKALAKPVVEFV